MSLAWNGYEIAGLALNGSAVSACYNGELIWPVGGGSERTVCLVGDATATAYATAYVDGNVYTSWYTNSSAVESVPDGATLVVRTETPNYYRHSGISSNCSAFTSGVNSGYGRSLTGSGYVTEDATASVNGTNTNTFTATGGFQTVTSQGSASGQCRPYKLSLLNTTYDFAKDGISGTFSSQGAVRTSWSAVTLSADKRLLTGVPFSSFSAYVFSRGTFGYVNQNKTAYCSAGMYILKQSSFTTGRYRKTQGPVTYSAETNYTADTYQATTAYNNQISIYSTISWGGTVGSISTYGYWSATGIAP